jgi:NADH:ubiquinone oxidoreductase subunit K
MPLLYPLVFAAFLFSVGVYGELMLNAVNINLVAFSAYLQDKLLSGQVFALFVVAVAAAEVGIGLAIVLLIYRNRETVNIDEVDLLRW